MGPHRLAYILAASHSGSTLLALLLGTHPRVLTVGELKLTDLGDLDSYLCSCGERLRACGFWTGVGAELAAQGIPFELGDAGTDLCSGASSYERLLLRPLHRGVFLESVRDAGLFLSPSWRRRLPRLQRRNAALVACLLTRTGAEWVVDSSKVGLRLKYLLRNPALEVRVVRLIRDGRAVALTYLNPSSFADATEPSRRGGGGGERADGRLTMEAAAREWRRSNEEAEALLSGLPPSRWTAIRYEDLCRAPEETLARLFDFLGLEPRPIAAVSPARQHVIGNGMRLDRHVEVRLDERWRSVLGSEQLRAFDAIASDLNRKYGYA